MKLTTKVLTPTVRKAKHYSLVYALSVLLTLGSVVFGTNQLAHAAKSDFSQPIDVKADRSEYSEKNGKQTLSGNVEIRQGTMVIKADEIDVSLKDNKLNVITGKGNPISFEQENEQGELVTGSCQNIIYDATKGVLTLLGNANLSQPKQQLRSEKIVFNSINQTVIAEGGQSGQVSIQIQPPDQN